MRPYCPVAAWLLSQCPQLWSRLCVCVRIQVLRWIWPALRRCHTPPQTRTPYPPCLWYWSPLLTTSCSCGHSLVQVSLSIPTLAHADCLYSCSNTCTYAHNLSFFLLWFYVYCPGDQLGPNRQSSVHANPFSQHTALGKPTPNDNGLQAACTPPTVTGYAVWLTMCSQLGWISMSWHDMDCMHDDNALLLGSSRDWFRHWVIYRP